MEPRVSSQNIDKDLFLFLFMVDVLGKRKRAKHICSLCGKGFTTKSGLTYHLKTLSCKKSYSCSECDNSFIQKDSLTEHLRIHTGEKPYSCSECGKRFIQKRGLTYHLKTHTEENHILAVSVVRALDKKVILQYI